MSTKKYIIGLALAIAASGTTSPMLRSFSRAGISRMLSKPSMLRALPQFKQLPRTYHSLSSRQQLRTTFKQRARTSSFVIPKKSMLTQSNTYEHRTLENIQKNDPLTALLIVAGGLGAYGLYKWFFPSDATLLENGRSALTQATDCVAAIGGNQQAQQHLDVYGMNEQKLCTVAAQITHSEWDTHAHITYLDGVIKVLQDSLYYLEKRVPNTSGLTSTEMTGLIYQMKNKLTLLNNRREYLAHHAAFFNVYAVYYTHKRTYKMIWDQFDFDANVHNPNGVRAAVLDKQQGTGKSSFPFLAYEERLAGAIKKLADKAYYAGSYGIMKENAELLVKQLSTIKATILASADYQQNIRDKKEYEAEQRRLSLERERIAIEQEKAHAQRSKADAEHRKARAEEERNRIERERLQLERQQLHQNQQQPHQPQHAGGGGVNITINNNR